MIVCRSWLSLTQLDMVSFGGGSMRSMPSLTSCFSSTSCFAPVLPFLRTSTGWSVWVRTTAGVRIMVSGAGDICAHCFSWCFFLTSGPNWRRFWLAREMKTTSPYACPSPMLRRCTELSWLRILMFVWRGMDGVFATSCFTFLARHTRIHPCCGWQESDYPI